MKTIKYYDNNASIIVTLDNAILSQMIAHGKSNLEDEVCGVCIGHKADTWEPTEFIPIVNVVKSPEYRLLKEQLRSNEYTDYIPHPTQFLEAIRKTTHFDSSSKFDFIAIFHTHPHNHPRPSLTDIRGAGYEALYIIYSPMYDEISYNYHDGINTGFTNAEVKLI